MLFIFKVTFSFVTVEWRQNLNRVYKKISPQKVSPFHSLEVLTFKSEQKKDTNRVMSFPDDKNVLFLGIVVSHREHINSNDILVYGIN